MNDDIVKQLYYYSIVYPFKKQTAEESIRFENEDKWEVDIVEWESRLRTLAKYNRFAATENTQDSGRIHEAGNWIKEQMKKNPNLTVSTESVFVFCKHESYNIIGTLTGSKYPEIKYVVGAHYDSTSEKPEESAPGALDNASGTAAVLELARIFSQLSPPITMIFVLFTGEEQGMFGSKRFLQTMFQKKEIENIKFMLNMDMIGLDPEIIVESTRATLIKTWEKQARASSLVPKIARKVWGSDHVTFDKYNIPAILTCSNHNKYPHYHSTQDLPDNLNVEVARNTIIMNTNSIISLMKREIFSL